MIGWGEPRPSPSGQGRAEPGAWRGGGGLREPAPPGAELLDEVGAAEKSLPPGCGPAEAEGRRVPQGQPLLQPLLRAVCIYIYPHNGQAACREFTVFLAQQPVP